MSLARKTEPEIYIQNKNSTNTSSGDKLAGYFYNITNHKDLFKIGKGIMNEIEKGVKNFAFTSTGYKNSQQKSILGLCCFFDQNTNHKIAVISDQLKASVFTDLVEASNLNIYTMSNGADTIKYKSFFHHFDFIDYTELIQLYENYPNSKHFDIELKTILKNYDVVLWDIPDMESMKQNRHFHYRVSHFYESMTVIVSPNASSGKEVEFIKSYFSNYNINLNGVLFDTSGLKGQPKRRKILGIF